MDTLKADNQPQTPFYVKGEPLPSEADFYKLRSGELLSGHSIQDAKLRCRLYQTYLANHLF